MSTTAFDVINVMRGWLGSESHRSIIDIYNAHRPLAQGYRMSYQDAWCDATVSAAFITLDAVDLIGGTECGVERHIQLFKKAGIWEEDGTVVPEPGWIITFNWDSKKQPNDGFADHIGIVESVVGNTVNTIEGNSNGRVARCSYALVYGNIRGYAKPKYDAAVMPKTYQLVADVSEHQGVIDWDVFSKEIDGVIIRAYNGSREDKYWKRNVSEAERLGVPYGVYLYSKATTITGAIAENTALLELLDGHRPQYPVYLDREEAGATAKLIADRFYSDIIKAGFVPGIYSGWYFYNTWLAGAKTESLWLAAYGSNNGTAQTGYKPTIDIDGWQYTSVARVGGITVNTVDLSQFYKAFVPVAKVGLRYKAHCQTYGWMQPVEDGAIAGTTGQAKRLECLIITPPSGVELEVKAHMQTYGDKVYTGIKPGTSVEIGTTGQKKRLEALTIKCVKNDTGKRLKYQAHVQGIGWQLPCNEGELAGTTGMAKRMEAIRIWFE